jgi:hypothetical protein
MPTWCKAVLKTVGAVDAALTALGGYWLFCSVWGGVFTLETSPDAPYFRIAFAAMTAINAAFLLLFASAAIQLLRLRKSGVIVHAVISGLLIAYSFLVGMLWLAPHNLGRSIAAATGVENMGIAPFELLFVVPYAESIFSALALLVVPIVYPIASTLALIVTHRKMAATHEVSVRTATV